MKKTQKNKSKWWIDGILGSIIGLVNGFLGSGGGMLCVPMLEKIKKMPTKKAHATAISVMFPFSIISGVIYMLNFEIEWASLGLITLGASLGALVGCICLKKLSGKAISLIFAVIMAFSGVWMVIA